MSKIIMLNGFNKKLLAGRFAREFKHKMEDKWDDTYILEAFNRAVLEHDGIRGDETAAARFEKRVALSNAEINEKPAGTVEEEESSESGGDFPWVPVEKSDTGKMESKTDHIQPNLPPQYVPWSSAESGQEQHQQQQQQDLSALLLAWYNAGYQAGRYAALYGAKSA